MKKLGFFSALTMVLVFAGGFILGYQYATTPAVSDSGESILFSLFADADSGEPEAEQTDGQAENAANNETADSDQAVQPETVAVPAEASASTGSALTQQEVVDVAEPGEASATEDAALLTDTAEPAQTVGGNTADINFSIQVGIYATLKNAQKMKRKLQAQNLDAYVSTYTRNDKIRFNVRMGYFEDRKSANLALNNYKKIQKGDGYLVNFSAKNIIHSDQDDYELAIMESAAATSANDISVPDNQPDSPEPRDN